MADFSGQLYGKWEKGTAGHIHFAAWQLVFEINGPKGVGQFNAKESPLIGSQFLQARKHWNGGAVFEIVVEGFFRKCNIIKA
ncbi:MAG TPA: hypothetical protein DCP36_01855 [Sporomusaceae bacterium]|nr:hypothetical protein [Sporomusaceae bacterium]